MHTVANQSPATPTSASCCQAGVCASHVAGVCAHHGAPGYASVPYRHPNTSYPQSGAGSASYGAATDNDPYYGQAPAHGAYYPPGYSYPNNQPYVIVVERDGNNEPQAQPQEPIVVKEREVIIHDQPENSSTGDIIEAVVEGIDRLWDRNRNTNGRSGNGTPTGGGITGETGNGSGSGSNSGSGNNGTSNTGGTSGTIVIRDRAGRDGTPSYSEQRDDEQNATPAATPSDRARGSNGRMVSEAEKRNEVRTPLDRAQGNGNGRMVSEAEKRDETKAPADHARGNGNSGAVREAEKVANNGTNETEHRVGSGATSSANTSANVTVTVKEAVKEKVATPASTTGGVVTPTGGIGASDAINLKPKDKDAIPATSPAASTGTIHGTATSTVSGTASVITMPATTIPASSAPVKTAPKVLSTPTISPGTIAPGEARKD